MILGRMNSFLAVQYMYLYSFALICASDGHNAAITYFINPHGEGGKNIGDDVG